ncbi:conserved hypothetical protein [Tenacibaculum sp. 190524A05c]|uniref:hypothetical protein n=1 Tax=Tenacibaculum platacis TaxID=3137852 RepID=UPI0031FB948F
MKFYFNNVFSKPIPIEFRDYVLTTIKLIGNLDKEIEIEELLELLISHDIPKKEAHEITIFLPIAFCRKILYQVNWLPYYFNFYSENKKVRKTFSKNKRYRIIDEVTSTYFDVSTNSNVILKIASLSTEFNVINNLLIKNPDANLEEIKLTPTYIVR